MAVIVTTPTDAPGVTYLTPSNTNQPPVTAASAMAPKTPVIAPVNTTGVRHLVLPAPIKRWNGTTWVVQYVPRM